MKMLDAPIQPFKLERFFAEWEFNTEYLLCSSDVEGYAMRELLLLADDETRALWDDLSLGYTESPGHPLLRREIARGYSTIGDEQVIVFNSGEEPIYIAMRALLREGDHAIVTWPGYQSHYEVARSIGADVTFLPLRLMGERWMIDLTELNSALRHNTKLIVTNFPHNPTGALPTKDEWKELIDFIKKANLFWLSDEVYRGLEFDATDRLSNAADEVDRAISVGAMSKTFALAGLRIGWIASKDDAIRSSMQRYKDYTTICNSAPSEILALIALRAKEKVIERSVNIVKSNLALANEFFKRHEEMFKWVAPTAGSIGFPKLLRGDVEKFAAELIRAENTLLMPAGVYDYPHNHFRLGLGRKNFSQALARLENFAIGYAGA
jgi:aspartate/methionine/tyrosine aminotransferase